MIESPTHTLTWRKPNKMNYGYCVKEASHKNKRNNPHQIPLRALKDSRIKLDH